MSHGEDNSRASTKTLPGLGFPVESRDHRAFLASPFRHWDAEESRLKWFLGVLDEKNASTDVAHWYGELLATPRRPGQIELALAALARTGSAVARATIDSYITDNERAAVYKQVCLAHLDELRLQSGR